MNPVAYLEAGVLHCADNLRILGEMPSKCVDLVYLDPPFFSNRHYEVIWGDEAEVRSFEDRWEGGIAHYLEWIEPRMRHLHRVLKDDGTLYLHCDLHAGHYLKVMMDRIFDGGQFVNEVVWKRTGAHSGKKGFGPAHDTILVYSKSDEFFWEPIRGPYDPEYVATKFTMKEADGRRYQAISLTPSGTRGGETGQPWRGIDPTARGYHWKYRPSKLDELDAEGMIYWPKKAGGMPRLKFFLDEAPGMLLQDVWTDVPPINARAAERLGYPTQKPEALLERIIQSSSAQGAVVLDPFCGCGTSVAVAEKLQRKWIGIDISPSAVGVMRDRLSKLGADFEVNGLPTTVADLRKLGPFEFQNWIVRRVLGDPHPRKSGDMGIDGYSFFEQLPIQVKQRDRVGRNDIDNFETAIERAGSKKGYFVAFSFTRTAHEEAARAKQSRGIHVVLVRVEDLVKVGNLVDSADRAGKIADLSFVSPDLMGLFSALQSSAVDRPFYTAPRNARPTDDELFASAQLHPGQQELALN